ncbi:chitinase [Kitasatospora kifunensis]|uniref:Chitinase n=1 Tax=Kitasatospora kifunensis TaxID=58351 RepID=A0A7W7R8F3_KITKI|nr:chitinase [Kitasatospora kifunensis]MBB4927340.1 chitinase [Kitasatospora kifunensis]
MRRPPRLASVLVPLALTAGIVLSTPVSGHAASGYAATPPGPGFPPRYTAPYIETWQPGKSLTEAQRATGLKYFTLAFVISDGGCNGALDGTTAVTDEGWQSAVNRLRAGGGDVIASFGGGAGTELALVCESVDSLKAAYRRVIDALNLTRVDFDIEGAAVSDSASVERRNRALAELQREYAARGRTLNVHYTLPVNPDGLSPESVLLLQNAKKLGVTISVVNIMTMDYGPDLNMGRMAISAADGLLKQMAKIWPEKSTTELWGMQGNTPMVGVNDATNEIFSTEDARMLARFANDKGIQLLAFWSVGRDQACLTEAELPANTCSGTSQQPADFAHLLSRPRLRPAPDWRPPHCIGLSSSHTACAGLLPPPVGGGMVASPGQDGRALWGGRCGSGWNRSAWSQPMVWCRGPVGR